MYEKCVSRNLGRFDSDSGVSLCFYFIWSLFDFFFLDHFSIILGMIEPVIKCDGSLGVFFDLVCHFHTWHLILKDSGEAGRTYAQTLGHTALFFAIFLYPFSELIQFFTFLYCFFCTKIQQFSTIESVTDLKLLNQQEIRV